MNQTLLAIPTAAALPIPERITDLESVVNQLQHLWSDALYHPCRDIVRVGIIATIRPLAAELAQLWRDYYATNTNSVPKTWDVVWYHDGREIWDTGNFLTHGEAATECAARNKMSSMKWNPLRVVPNYHREHWTPKPYHFTALSH